MSIQGNVLGIRPLIGHEENTVHKSAKSIGFEGHLLIKISACIPIIGEISSRLAQASLVKKYALDGRVDDDEKIVELKNQYKLFDVIRRGISLTLLQSAIIVTGIALLVFFGVILNPVLAVAIALSLIVGFGALIGYKAYKDMVAVDHNQDIIHKEQYNRIIDLDEAQLQ